MVSDWRTNTYKVDVYLEDSSLKYLLHLDKVDETSAYEMYKNFEREQNKTQDECLKFGWYEYKWDKVLNTVCVTLIVFQ